MTRISHVSAVHNEEQWLEVMVGSWLKQAVGQDAELLIIDDHSDDATAQIGSRLADEHARIRFFSLADERRQRGKVAAFNLGVERAEGEFIGLIAGDDEFPSDALANWSSAVQQFHAMDRVVAFGRLRTMSDIKKADGITIPRRARGNRSGGTSLFTRALAQIVFPIPEELPSEDTWTAFLLEAKADVVIEVPAVVLHYRIHAGNSNPRGKDFSHMSAWMSRQSRAYELMLGCDRLSLTKEQRSILKQKLRLQELRATGKVAQILGAHEFGRRDRVRVVLMSRPALWRLRQGLFRYLSGW